VSQLLYKNEKIRRRKTPFRIATIYCSPINKAPKLWAVAAALLRRRLEYSASAEAALQEAVFVDGQRCYY
jgi:hypothetical protein